MNAREEREFFEAVKFISADKGVSAVALIDRLKTAIVLAVKKQYIGTEKIDVVIDFEAGRFEVSISKLVVEEVKDVANEISLDDALKYSNKAKLFEYLKIDVNSKCIGRLAAQAAKQQIMQGIRDVERENIAEKMEDRVGNIISAPVEMIDPQSGNVILKIDGSDAVLFKNNQLPKDEFVVGRMVKVYGVFLDSNKSSCLLKISRTHPEFVRKLFELEVPEIIEGKIEIKSIAREAGIRTKIAVSSNDPDIEPVGCLIGGRGVRVNSIVDELCGERIDVVKYSSDPKVFVPAALAPAEVDEIEILDVEGIEKVAFVAVPENKISLAIGARGLNTKLAAVLTGYKIDISPSNMVVVDGSKKMLKAKLEAKLAQRSVQSDQIVNCALESKTQEELDEESDIHSYEVEQMLCDRFMSKKIN